ncbi:MAG: 4-hydroxy-tetrahydrodipicolinate reductase [Spirochaetaceae bacterium]|jgi:4-hydroxy-tetrahydrodipicolinate reductase|nr:4-hydroxy-tetrahydrodipicolinate reductase [Spirochaetaceae bacterium]
MKIILVGYGKMGRLIEKRAVEKGHEIAAVIDPGVENKLSGQGARVFKSVDAFEKEEKERGTPAECIAIDFSHPASVERNIRDFAERRIPLVVGTTGWYDKLEELSGLVKSKHSSLLWASNFSLGVNIFYKIASYCAAIFDNYGEYDVAGYEIHHKQKADSPSGTAKTIGGIMLKNMKRKNKLVWDKLDRPPEADEIHFASLRSGAEPGVHGLIFDSAVDSIEIKHTARNREGLVYGAILAAEWLEKTTRSGKYGVFTMEDVLG